ncbi:unnamed protein product [Clonostachys rosea]|uniref:Nephrocystin 3-like N-terminal domain-containing protein n=1 Tax=Bionectria ochroleuca TaxID=29856 RepID=A0ABY6USB0_BIOOC|nr:unnamed protein product [Clonostachys rosea]
MAQEAVSCWQAALARLSPETQQTLDSLQKNNHTSGASSAEIDSIIMLSKSKQAQCGSKQWAVKIGSRHVNVRHAFSRMVDWLDKFKAFGDMALNVDPVHAALPWAAFRFILQSFIAEREQMGYIIAILEDAARLVHHGRVFENLYLGASSKLQDPICHEALNDLQNDTVELYITILDGLSFCCSQMQKHTILRVGIALLKPEDAKNASEQLHNRWLKLKDQAQKCDSLRILQISDEIQHHLPGVFSTLDKILVKMQDQERINILRTISVTQAYRGHRIDIQERRTKGTGDWILQSEAFQQWQASESSAITLLYGAPGAGKTFLTSRVIDHVEKSPDLEGFAYFYCKRDEEERSQPVSILRSLVRQLSSAFERPKEIHQEVQALKTKIEEQAMALSVELSVAIKIDSESTDRLFDFRETLTETDIYSLCYNLLKLEKEETEEGVWRFCHLSAIEYIETRLVDQLQPHRNTASACIKYLLAMCHCKAEWDENLDRYIGWRWPEFVRRQENAQDARLCQFLFQFLGSPYTSSRAYQTWVLQMEEDYLLTTCRSSSSALYAICELGLAWVFKEWCETNHNIDPNSCDGRKRSLLGLAAYGGHADLCHFLLKKGADISKGSLHPFLIACQDSHEATVRVLIEAGARVNDLYRWNVTDETRDVTDETPIQIAMSTGEHTAIVRLLLDHQAEPNLKARDGTTALDIAVLEGHRNIITLLLQNGASLGNLSLALQGAAQHNMVEWIEKCIDAGVDVNAYSEKRMTALISASQCGSTEAIKRLLELGADVNMVQKTARYLFPGHTALAVAATYGRLSTIKLLLSEGADPNIHGQETSPLINAASTYSSVRCLDALLDAGADVNYVSKKSTALIEAIGAKSQTKVQSLLRAGADPNLSTKGKCPLITVLDARYDGSDKMKAESSSEDKDENQFEQQFDEDSEDSFDEILDKLSHDRLNEIFDRTGKWPLNFYGNSSDATSYEGSDTIEDSSEDSTEDGLAVIGILLQSGADVPMPIYHALGPGVPNLKLWGEHQQFADSILYTRLGFVSYGKYLQGRLPAYPSIERSGDAGSSLRFLLLLASS